MQPDDTGEVTHWVGWLVPDGSTDVRVEVNGRPIEVTTTEGLGMVEVRRNQLARVFATLPDGSRWHLGISGGNADPFGGNEYTDLYPPSE